MDHLTGDHPEFWDPEKLRRVRRDTGLIEAAVTATIRLPVVNSGFLDFGDRRRPGRRQRGHRPVGRPARPAPEGLGNRAAPPAP